MNDYFPKESLPSLKNPKFVEGALKVFSEALNQEVTGFNQILAEYAYYTLSQDLRYNFLASLSQNSDDINTVTELERFESLIEDEEQNNHSYNNWEVILGSILASGLPISHVNSQVLNKFDLEGTEQDRTIFKLVVALLAQEEESDLLQDQKSVLKNVTHLLYILSNMKINTNSLTNVLWDNFLANINLPDEVLALFLIFQLDFIKNPEIQSRIIESVG